MLTVFILIVHTSTLVLLNSLPSGQVNSKFSIDNSPSYKMAQPCSRKAFLLSLQYVFSFYTFHAVPSFFIPLNASLNHNIDALII